MSIDETKIATELYTYMRLSEDDSEQELQKPEMTELFDECMDCIMRGNPREVVKLIDMWCNDTDFKKLDKISNRSGFNLFLAAVGNNYTDLVKFLVNRGCNKDVVNHRGLTALDIAKRKGAKSRPIIDFLESLED